MKRASLAALALASACSRSAAPVVERAAATPTPPPRLLPEGTPSPLPDGRIEYRFVLRAESGTIFVPLEIRAASGDGHVGWTSHAHLRFDAPADAFVADAGSDAEEYVNAVFPASAQEIRIPVRFEGTPPRAPNFRLRYRTVAIGELASRAYVRETIGEPGTRPAETRHPLGSRIRDVDVSRRLSSGFLLRDPGPLFETTASVASGGTP